MLRIPVVEEFKGIQWITVFSPAWILWREDKLAHRNKKNQFYYFWKLEWITWFLCDNKALILNPELSNYLPPLQWAFKSWGLPLRIQTRIRESYRYLAPHRRQRWRSYICLVSLAKYQAGHFTSMMIDEVAGQELLRKIPLCGNQRTDEQTCPQHTDLSKLFYLLNNNLF